jgi:hypothetical protein
MGAGRRPPPGGIYLEDDLPMAAALLQKLHERNAVKLYIFSSDMH